jgi:hypothetical protein
MDQHEIAVMTAVRMGIQHRNSPMSRPARMANADMTVTLVRLKTVQKSGHPTDIAMELKCIIGLYQADTGGIITPIFQALEPFKDKGCRWTTTHITDNATHDVSLLCVLPVFGKDFHLYRLIFIYFTYFLK